MIMLDRRLQILIDDDRYRRLVATAEARGVPVAVVVRDALDQALPADPDSRARAGWHILTADRMEVPDVEELRRELDDLRARRA
jgi:hypothetical protein